MLSSPFSSRDGGNLKWRDQVLHMGLYSVDNDLWDHYINSCVETNWPKVAKDFRTISLQDKSHQGMVQIWGNSLSCEDSQNFINDWWFEYVPKMLEESSMKAVHSRGFIRFQRGEGLENFRIWGHDRKLAGVLIRESNSLFYFKVYSGDGGQVLGLIELFVSTKNNVHHLIFVLNPFPRLIHNPPNSVMLPFNNCFCVVVCRISITKKLPVHPRF